MDAPAAVGSPTGAMVFRQNPTGGPQLVHNLEGFINRRPITYRALLSQVSPQQTPTHSSFEARVDAFAFLPKI